VIELPKVDRKYKFMTIYSHTNRHNVLRILSYNCTFNLQVKDYYHIYLSAKLVRFPFVASFLLVLDNILK
jgi:hypothetical protein